MGTREELAIDLLLTFCCAFLNVDGSELLAKAVKNLTSQYEQEKVQAHVDEDEDEEPTETEREQKMTIQYVKG